MADRYTNAMLTIIAIALVAIAIQEGTRRASADADCGYSVIHPCNVYVTNWPNRF